MSFLLLTGAGKDRAHDVALYAADPAHWYRPGISPFVVPGDLDVYTAQIDSFRCVFTYTHHEGVLFRHLSISVAARMQGRVPQPIVAFTLATWFGFTGGDVDEEKDVTLGPGADWAFSAEEEPVAHVVLVQRIGAQP